MNYHGDIPINHLELMNELRTLEDWFKDNGSGLPSITAAKGFVSMAHDWYGMECDEKGGQLLETADLLYTRYFEGPIHDHTKNDPDFAQLVRNMRKMPLALKYMKSLGFK